MFSSLATSCCWPPRARRGPATECQVLTGYAPLFTSRYNRRLLELLPGITGLCRTPQNDINYNIMPKHHSPQIQPKVYCKVFPKFTLSRSSTRSRPPSNNSFVPSSAFSRRLVMYLARQRLSSSLARLDYASYKAKHFCYTSVAFQPAHTHIGRFQGQDSTLDRPMQ